MLKSQEFSVSNKCFDERKPMQSQEEPVDKSAK